MTRTYQSKDNTHTHTYTYACHTKLNIHTDTHTHMVSLAGRKSKWMRKISAFGSIQGKKALDKITERKTPAC